MTKLVTTYRINGQTISINRADEGAVVDRLPAGYYTIKQSMFGFFLEKADNFELPSKMYGNVYERTERIMTTFMDRPRSTGVLLEGDKGGGKSLLAKNVCVQAVASGIPVLISADSYSGQQYNEFLNSIDQPAVVLYDEFDKQYGAGRIRDDDGDLVNDSENKPDSASLLTLFDGVYQSKKLYLLTVNGQVNEFLLNRPGRMFYRFIYDSLDEEVIRQYTEDRLNDKSKVDALVDFTGAMATLNFDMLQAIVEEMNRYSCDAIEACNYLNISNEDGASYDVFVYYEGKELTPRYTYASLNIAETNFAWQCQYHFPMETFVNMSGKTEKAADKKNRLRAGSYHGYEHCEYGSYNKDGLLCSAHVTRDNISSRKGGSFVFEAPVKSTDGTTIDAKVQIVVKRAKTSKFNYF